MKLTWGVSRRSREEIAELRARIVEAAVEYQRLRSEGRFDAIPTCLYRLMTRTQEYLDYLEQIDIEYS